MKQKIEKLVNELACKELGVGCEIILKSALRDHLDTNKRVRVFSYTKFKNTGNEDIRIQETVFANGYIVLKNRDKIEKIIGNPITIQTVLMRPEISNKILRETDVLHTILHLWKKCGDKSLQEIISCGYADGFTQEEDELFKDMKDKDKNWMKMPVLKNPDAQNLIDYLLNIFG